MIFNSQNNKIYIGKTKCLYKRCHQYLYDIRERKIGHINDYLFNAINKIGLDHFDFIPLEFCEPSLLHEREEFWILELRTLDRNYGYNLRMDDDRGLITNPETSIKMSNNLKKQWADGIRDGHSDKLKKKWESDPHRRELQSLLFTKYKTKYEYEVYINDEVKVLLYKDLIELGLGNVVSSFHRKGTNDVMCKGIRVIRKPLGESNEIIK